MVIFTPSSRKKRMSLRPDITGSAQTHGRNNLTFRQCVCYDLSCYHHLTFRNDLNILFTPSSRSSKEEASNSGRRP